MTPRYRLRPAADRDLDDQAAYLASEASLDTALRFYDAAGVTFGKIARTPRIGERRETTKPRLSGLRIWRVEGFERHLIFDLPADDGVEIIRVPHGARDIDRILAETSDDEPAH
jgi:toxin ParE1/3/4